MITGRSHVGRLSNQWAVSNRKTVLSDDVDPGMMRHVPWVLHTTMFHHASWHPTSL